MSARDRDLDPADASEPSEKHLHGASEERDDVNVIAHTHPTPSDARKKDLVVHWL
jgi:hypothetical protein